MAKPLVVDADGHILEPPDAYERHIEPRYRDRAMRLKFDAKGLEYLEIDGKQAVMTRGGVLGNLGGAYMNAADLFTPGKYTYWEVAQRYPGAIDPDARIAEMDEQGIDIAVLYPTLGIVWEEDNKDPELSAAYCRAYNNYLIDFCSKHPDRLIPIAHVNLRDVDLAVTEVQRVKDKVKGLFYTPFPGSRRSVGDRYYDRFWGAAEAFGLPVSTHVQGRETFHGHGLHAQASPWFYFMQLPGETQLSLNCVMMEGVLERFPRLRYVVLEIGCGWLPYWMERADEKYECFSFATQMTRKPSQLFREHCWISTETDETTIPEVIRMLGGASRMLWATDYPHVDAHPDPLPTLREHIKMLPPDQQEWILGKGAAELYRL